MPSLGAITGVDNVCIGSSITLSNATAGGSWSASNGNVAVSSVGVVVGISAGTVDITYLFSNACGTAISTKTVTVNDCPAGVDDLAPGEHISIFPNPTKGVITIASASVISSVVITDVAGRQVFHEAFNAANVQVDIARLSRGIYFIRINDGRVYKLTRQ